MADIVWYQFASSLQSHITPLLPGAAVQMGADRKTPTARTVRIKYGHTEPEPVNMLKAHGTVILLVECWEYHATDSAAAYAALASLHEELLTATRSWQVSGYTMEDKILSIYGDGDIYRPSVGSQCVLRIRYRRNNPELIVA